jgi:hypothetical protein
MSDLPWDPKWPGELRTWEDEYYRAKGDLAKPRFASMASAFTAIADADAKGAFKHLREIHQHSMDNLGLWPWRWALWEMYCVPSFDVANDNDLTGLAKTVYDAVPNGWLQSTPPTTGIPTSWHGKAKRISGCRAMVLLIGGLVENQMSPRSVPIMQRVTGFFEANASDSLKQELQTLLPGLAEALGPAV